MPLKAGDKAPGFAECADSHAETFLNDFTGKWIVLYFYPKDNTPGCTKEACEFRDNLDSLASKGVEVIGVSPDTPASHDKFREKFNLNFHLISDTDKSICSVYVVWGEKKFMGKKFMGVIRSTFIIDPNGIIRYVFPEVKVAGHVEAVKKALHELF